MASNLDKTDLSKVDPRLLDGSVDFFNDNAKMAADRLNQFGSTLSAAQKKVYEDMYANGVAKAKEYAAATGVKYTPPEIISAAAREGKVIGVGTSMLTSKANDMFATVDGYGKTLEQNLTTVSNSVKNSMAAAQDWLFNTDIPGLGSLSDLKNTFDSSAATVNGMYEQLNSAINKPINQVKGMSDALLSSTMNQLDKLSSLTSGPTININGVQIPSIIGAKIPAINGLVDTYNNTKRSIETTYARVRDLPAELAMRLALIDQGGKLGLSGFISHLIDNDDQNNDQIYHVALIDQFDYALSNGQLDIIEEMLSKLGQVTVLNRYPDAVNRLLRAYRFPVGTTIAEYATCRQDLIKTLTALDPRWLYNPKVTDRNIINMSVFVGCSDAIASAFATDKYYYRLVLSVKNFTAYANGSLVSTAKQMYPYSAISTT